MQCIVNLLFRYIFQLCDPRYKDKKLQIIEFEMNQTTSPDTGTPATIPSTSPKKNGSFILFGAELTFVLAILISHFK